MYRKAFWTRGARDQHSGERSVTPESERVQRMLDEVRANVNSFEASYARFQWRLVVALFLFGYAGMLLLGQVVYWLRFQEWMEFPLLYLLVEPPVGVFPRAGIDPYKFLPFLGNWTWLQSPQSWFGLHQIVYKVLASLHFGLLPFAIGVWVLVTDLFEPAKPTKADN